MPENGPRENQPATSAEEQHVLDELTKMAPRLNVPADDLRAVVERLVLEHAQEKTMPRPGPVYDAVFRTVIERLGRLVIQLVNYLFGTAFTGEERILCGATETVQRDGTGLYRSIRSDSHFTIIDGAETAHPFHIECNLRKDGTLLFRIAEYDMMLALDSRQEHDWGWEYTLPHSAVILLRSRHGRDEGSWKYRITGENGEYLEQNVRVLALPSMSADELLREDLLALAPFYAFTYGASLHRLESTAEGRQQLLREEQDFRDRLASAAELTEVEKIRLLELTTQVLHGLIRDDTLREHMEEIMYPGTIELESDRIIASAREEGLAEGLAEGEELGIIRAMRLLKKEPAAICAALVQLLGCTPIEAERMVEAYVSTHGTSVP